MLTFQSRKFSWWLTCKKATEWANEHLTAYICSSVPYKYLFYMKDHWQRIFPVFWLPLVGFDHLWSTMFNCPISLFRGTIPEDWPHLSHQGSQRRKRGQKQVVSPSTVLPMPWSSHRCFSSHWLHTNLNPCSQISSLLLIYLSLHFRTGKFSWKEMQKRIRTIHLRIQIHVIFHVLLAFTGTRQMRKTTTDLRNSVL